MARSQKKQRRDSEDKVFERLIGEAFKDGDKQGSHWFCMAYGYLMELRTRDDHLEELAKANKGEDQIDGDA